MVFALEPSKDPGISMAALLVNRFAREVWNATLPLSFRDKAGLLLGVLASGVASYLSHHPRPPKKVSGPISALHLALAQGGVSLRGRLFCWISTTKRYTFRLFVPGGSKSISLQIALMS